MAVRPVFLPRLTGQHLVETYMVSFAWEPGRSLSQKRKSIANLHRAAIQQLDIERPLEISTKSLDPIGVSLSAFNLEYAPDAGGKGFPLESIFQASKVFENGGPFRDILKLSAIEAKRDPRLLKSGSLVCFFSNGIKWPLEPKTAFYDWLYINLLLRRRDLAPRLLNYDSFTDIEFNPKKSINCQAYSAALFVGLAKRGLIEKAVKSKQTFIDIVVSHAPGVTQTEDGTSGRLDI